MKKLLFTILTSFLFLGNLLGQYHLLYNLDKENGFNSIKFGTLKSSYSGQLDGEDINPDSGNSMYLYTGDSLNYYDVYGVAFRLLVMEFDRSNRLIEFRISQRYNSEELDNFTKDYQYLCDKLTALYGLNTINSIDDTKTFTGKIWRGSDAELWIHKLDVDPYGTKQLTISVKSLKLEVDNKMKALKQNISAIDNISGFDIYKFGHTMQEYGCETWICTKVPVNLSIGNNEVEAIHLNFRGNALFAIIISFKTGEQILETLTKKYGSPVKHTFNDMMYKNVQKYLWQGNKVGIQFYYENNKYSLHYYSILKMSLDEL